MERFWVKLGDRAKATPARDEAIRLAERTANGDDREAQAFLADHLFKEKQYRKAAALYLAAARHGHPKSEYMVYHMMHSLEKHTPRNQGNDESDLWLLKAAESGYPRAMLDVGRSFWCGIGHARGESLGRTWLIRAFRTGLGEKIAQIFSERK